MEFNIIDYILNNFHFSNAISLCIGAILNFIIPWKYIEMECRSPIPYTLCILVIISLIIHGIWPVLSLFVHLK